eukprot:7118848-Pyramimonas_sp.AAC.1
MRVKRLRCRNAATQWGRQTARLGIDVDSGKPPARQTRAARVKVSNWPSLARPFPVLFVRFRAWFFREMIKDAPR